ncbi:tannase and feruloyl esterase [Auricularia subglabra TFB-10046 SS5]|nr:tannase and feruloyl esterase [Auricularia subglabra TFB-10046 SS5]
MQLASTPIVNAHSIHATYLRANETYRVPASCGIGLGEDLRAQTAVNNCVVNVVYNTSASSATRIEAWLPDADAWSGRILGTGGGGFGGCVDYYDLAYGTTLGFASIGNDGGHDGDSIAAFAPSDEILSDWAHRSLHVATVTGKALVEGYYGRAHDKSYYIGCSTGGRQGFRSVQQYPEDFDGVLAGAPVIDEVHLLATGATYATVGQALDAPAWRLINAEILNQCDGLDGLHDGIIDDPDACAFVPETLLCEGAKQPDCLSVEQVNAIRTIHAPFYGPDGKQLAPHLDPGAEANESYLPALFGPLFFTIGLDWWKYVVYNDTNWKPAPNFGFKEIADAERRDKEVRVTSSPDINAFRERGGKLLTYHGSRDILIPHGWSLQYYQLVARTLGLPPSQLDDFYRLFLIPGMDHCFNGPGAWAFGQIGFASWTTAPESNALLALVDWVEKGKAPETIRGLAVGANSTAFPNTRLHCKYPARSVWKPEAKDWACVTNP